MGTTFSKVKLKDGSIRYVKDSAARQDIVNIQSSITDIYSSLEEATIQVEVMPIAVAAEAGKIYQYIGATNTNYTNGYFYKCVEGVGGDGYVAPDNITYPYYYYLEYNNDIIAKIYSNYKCGGYDDHLYYYKNNNLSNSIATRDSTKYPYGSDVMWISCYRNGEQVNANMAINYVGSAFDYNFETFNTQNDLITYLNTPDYHWERVNVQPEAPAQLQADWNQNDSSAFDYIKNKPEIQTIQVATLPTASAKYIGKIVQYIGQTNITATKGYFYWCSADPYPGSYTAPDGRTYSYRVQTTGQNNFKIYSNIKIATYAEALDQQYGYKIYAKKQNITGNVVFLNSSQNSWYPTDFGNYIVICSSADQKLTGNWTAWANSNGADGIPIFDTYEEMVAYLEAPIYKWYQINVQPEGEAPCITQAYILPTPANTNLHHVYQYMGQTNENYTNKAFYMVVYDTAQAAYKYEQVLYTVEEVNNLVSGVNENNYKELYVAETPGFSSNDIELNDYISKYMYLMVETISPAATQEDIDVSYIDKLGDLDVGDTFTVTDSKSNTITFRIKNTTTIEVVSYSTSCPLYINKVTGIRFGTTGQGDPGLDERVQDIELALDGHTVGTDVPANAQFGYDDKEVRTDIYNIKNEIGSYDVKNYFCLKSPYDSQGFIWEVVFALPTLILPSVSGSYSSLENKLTIESFNNSGTYTILEKNQLCENYLAKNLPNGTYIIDGLGTYSIISNDAPLGVVIKGCNEADPTTISTIGTLKSDGDTVTIDNTYDYNWVEVQVYAGTQSISNKDYYIVLSQVSTLGQLAKDYSSRPKVPKYDASFYDHQYTFYGDGDSQSTLYGLHDGCFAVSSSANNPSDDPFSPLPPPTLQEVKIQGWDNIVNNVETKVKGTVNPGAISAGGNKEIARFETYNPTANGEIVVEGVINFNAAIVDTSTAAYINITVYDSLAIDATYTIGVTNGYQYINFKHIMENVASGNKVVRLVMSAVNCNIN